MDKFQKEIFKIDSPRIFSFKAVSGIHERHNHYDLKNDFTLIMHIYLFLFIWIIKFVLSHSSICHHISITPVFLTYISVSPTWAWTVSRMPFQKVVPQGRCTPTCLPNCLAIKLNLMYWALWRRLGDVKVNSFISTTVK